ncbi:hypothetical protein M153_15140002, partial [Pseudoloma neurophilia]
QNNLRKHPEYLELPEETGRMTTFLNYLSSFTSFNLQIDDIDHNCKTILEIFLRYKPETLNIFDGDLSYEICERILENSYKKVIMKFEDITFDILQFFCKIRCKIKELHYQRVNNTVDRLIINPECEELQIMAENQNLPEAIPENILIYVTESANDSFFFKTNVKNIHLTSEHHLKFTSLVIEAPNEIFIGKFLSFCENLHYLKITIDHIATSQMFFLQNNLKSTLRSVNILIRLDKRINENKKRFINSFFKNNVDFELSIGFRKKCKKERKIIEEH